MEKRIKITELLIAYGASTIQEDNCKIDAFGFVDKNFKSYSYNKIDRSYNERDKETMIKILESAERDNNVERGSITIDLDEKTELQKKIIETLEEALANDL